MGKRRLYHGRRRHPGNIKVAPTFQSPQSGDDHLTGMGETPCDLSQGGLDLSMLFTVDRYGEARSESWSIGAHELDAACN